jgi:nicotinate phosphoribosyltransferase
MGTALLTDKYEFTMLQAALRDGTADRKCVFELFTRRLPAGRRYGVVAGTGRFLEELASYRFEEEDLEYLRAEGVLDERTLDYLADYRFTGNIRGYAEGEIYFPHSPLMVVESTFAQGVLLETLALSILNYDSAVASAASRMTTAAGSRPCLDMGARRAHEQAAVSAARAAVIAGFAGTSNYEAARRHGLKAIGTAAHAWTLLHDSEEEAFRSQVDSLGVSTTLLVDTYDVTQGVETAIKVAGPELGAVRLDSGDLGVQAAEVRKQLDSLGATNTKITVTSDLDEHAIAALASAPVDSYGVGTRLVTGSGEPTSSMVYKLVLRENARGIMEPVQKASTAKASVGGTKSAVRELNSHGRGASEMVLVGSDAARETFVGSAQSVRPLHVPLVTDGVVHDEWLGGEGLSRAITRHRTSRDELPRNALRLSVGDPAIPTVTRSLD